jgi:hypothetical protein
MAADTSEQLLAAHEDGLLVRLSRAFEEIAIRGYVLDVGPKFFVLGLVNDRLWLDGYECFRVRDIRQVRPDPYAAFAEAALRARDQERPRISPVSVEDLEELLRSAGEAFPLVTLSKERIDPGVCSVGRVAEVTRTRVMLQEIGPDAIWEDFLSPHRLADVTRVNFGGSYESALYLVGREPPELDED